MKLLRNVGKELIEVRQRALQEQDESVPEDILTHAIKIAGTKKLDEKYEYNVSGAQLLIFQ